MAEIGEQQYDPRRKRSKPCQGLKGCFWDLVLTKHIVEQLVLGIVPNRLGLQRQPLGHS
jgi:hypothetical protein